MIRWVAFSIAVVAVAAIATVASTYFATGTDGPAAVVPTAQEDRSGPSGALVVDGSTTHQFGVMPQASDGSHEWTVTNKGPGVVKLSMGTPSCSCTIAELKDGKTATLAAGESTKVTLNWNTKQFHDKYRQTAPMIVSNDPATHQIEFAVEGNVQPAVSMMPTTGAVEFGTASVESSPSREVAFFSKDRPALKVSRGDAPESPLFEVSVMPLTSEECGRIKCEAGQKLVLTLKSTAPLGAFDEEILIATDHPKRPEVKVRALGTVVGPISLTPPRVMMLNVSAKRGETQVLTMWVRNRKDTKFTVEKKPKDFGVEIVPTGEPVAGGAMRYRVSVVVPPGVLAAQSITEEIVLKTDHPQAREVKIPVAVLVHAN